VSSFKVVIKNFSSLGLVQGVNYLVPIIVIPLLLDRVGMTNYGIISMVMGIINITVSLSDYGLTITSVRAVSSSPDDRSHHGRIYLMNLIIKTVLLFTLFLGLIVLTFVIPEWKQAQQVILLGYLLTVSSALLPTWYFQGIQKNAYSALLNLLAQLLYICTIIWYIQSPEQFYIVPFVKGACLLTATFIANLIVIKRVSISLSNLSVTKLIEYTRDNLSVFASVSTNSLYRNAPIILAGILLASESLGIFGIIDKFVWVMLGAFMVLLNSIYPSFCQQSQTDLNSAFRFLFKSLLRLSVLVVPAILFTFLWGADLLALITHETSAEELTPLIQLLSLVPLLIFFNIPVSIIIIGRNHRRAYLLYHLSQLVILVSAIVVLTPSLKIEGVIISMAIAELAAFILGSGFIVKRYVLTPQKLRGKIV
jgi:PST family polysaccharide transporter